MQRKTVRTYSEGMLGVISWRKDVVCTQNTRHVDEASENHLTGIVDNTLSKREEKEAEAGEEQ